MIKLGLTFILLLTIGPGLFGQNIQKEKNSFGFTNDTLSVSVSKTERTLFENRLESINSKNTIKIGIDSAVPEQVKRFLGLRWLPETMGLAEFYFYMFQKKLKKYLSLIHI